MARRVKCDQTRPACQRCIRAHRICSGFDRIEFVDEGPQLRSLYDAPGPGTPAFPPEAISGTFSTSSVSETEVPSGSRGIAANRDITEASQKVNEAGQWIQGAFERGALVTLLAPNVMQDQLLATFIASVREPVLASTFRSHSSWLTEVALRPSLSDSLTWAIRAISISNLGRKAEDPELIEVSRFLYGKSLVKLKRTLEDKDEGLSSDTLSATILLSFYEVFNCTNDYAWIRHAGGAGRLIQLRGPDRHRSGFGRLVFLACRTSVIMDAFQRSIPCFLEAPPWRKLCWDLHQDTSHGPLIFTNEEYFQELVGYPAFLRDVEQAIGNPDTTSERFSRLHTKALTHRSSFRSIHDRMGQEMLAAGTGPTETASSLQDSLFPVVYTYPDIHIATHYCCYWTIMCAINIAILGLEAKIASSQAKPAGPLPMEAQGLPRPAPVPSNDNTPASPSPEMSDPSPKGISFFWAAAKSRGNLPTYVAENAGYAREICKSAEFMYRTPFLGPLFLVVALRMALRMFISEAEKAWIVRMLKDIGERMGFAVVEVERYKLQRSKTIRAEWGAEGSPSHQGLVDAELER